MGFKDIIDGIKLKKKLEKERSVTLLDEINKEIYKDNWSRSTDLYQTNGQSYHNEFGFKNIREDVDKFVLTFCLILLAEFGEKSQISTIYVDSNSNSIFYCLIIAQVCLCLTSFMIGKLISVIKINQNKLKIISGSVFMSLGIISIFLLFINEYLFIKNVWQSILLIYNQRYGLETIPNKESIKKNFIK
jgi:putative Ca2+/H+ antiporter (TMEM165/GDT1 family)